VSELSHAIQGHLRCVERERVRRRLDPALAARVLEVKRYQHARFCVTYRDLLEASGSGKAARFFLEELYGPRDFSRRDAEFARAAPKITALFPGDIGRIVVTLANLHALSEHLDSEMGAAMASVPLSDAAYQQAWQAVGQPDARAEQIELLRQIGLALSKQVRRPFVHATLRMMRAPANAAGLGRLQSVLEAGFDAFRELPDAEEFVCTIAERETAIATGLFNASR
jgi:hypothetical protein